MHSKVKICFIGDGVHSKRVQKILNKKKIFFSIFKPKNKKNYKNEKIEYLKKFNTIFIMSPDFTHFYYIKKFHKNAYIFCEKPPCTDKSQLHSLKKLKTKKIYFNFNERFSILFQILKNSKKFNLGKLIYGNIIKCHALALKKEYKKNWRSTRKFSKNGILEVVSIHFIDLINCIFKIKSIKIKKIFNKSKYGNSFDNSILNITTHNNSTINIFNSWTSELMSKKIFIFENGSIEENENNLIIRGPALNLDKNNFTKKAKIIKTINYNNKNSANDTLTKSVNYFLEISSKKQNFDRNDYIKSLNSNSFVL